MIEIGSAYIVPSVLREIRDTEGISQEHWSNLSGLNRSRVSRYVRDQVVPDISTLVRLLKPIGYTLLVAHDEELRQFKLWRANREKINERRAEKAAESIEPLWERE